MKRFSLFLLSVFGFISLSACHVNSSDVRALTGRSSGPSVTRLLNAKYFSEIEADMVGSIVYTQSDSLSIRLVGPKSEVERMRVSFIGEELHITMDKGMKRAFPFTKRKGVDVYVSGPDLVKVDIEGVVDFKAKKIDTDRLEASVDGVGDIQIDSLICDHFKGSVDGTGDLRVGYLEALSVNASLDGTGDIRLTMVKVPNVKLKIDGTGDIRAHMKDCGTVKTMVDGTGNIELKGTCKHWIRYKDDDDKRPQERYNVNIK